MSRKQYKIIWQKTNQENLNSQGKTQSTDATDKMTQTLRWTETLKWRLENCSN